MRKVLLVIAVWSACAGAALAEDEHHCRLTPENKIANTKLSFDEFDQQGTTPSTWRALMKANCPGRAAEAADDYLVNGPAQTPEHKSDILFHEAQSLAIIGDYVQASRLVAAAIPADRANHGDLDWTTYLVGTWAFLVRDHVTLDAAAAKMAAEPGEPNRIDGAVLRGLSTCFDQSYDDAYNNCRPKN